MKISVEFDPDTEDLTKVAETVLGTGPYTQDYETMRLIMLNCGLEMPSWMLATELFALKDAMEEFVQDWVENRKKEKDRGDHHAGRTVE